MKLIINGKLNPDLDLSVKGKLKAQGIRITDSGVEVKRDLDLRGTEITELPDTLTVGGCLYLGRNTKVKSLPENLMVGLRVYLEGSQITELPRNLTVGHSIYLRRTRVKELPDNMSVGGHLDLRGTNITTLPNNLRVGGCLYLEGTQITELPHGLLSVSGAINLEDTNITNYPVVYNCGEGRRAIYLSPTDKTIIRIGCFSGTKSEAIGAINRKYEGEARDKYISQVEECFNMWEQMK